MTTLHRAGVAGLLEQLQYLESIECKPPHGFKWKISNQSIELDWIGNDLDTLQWLCVASFQIDDDGLICFPAIAQYLSFRQRLAVQIGLQKTFLQHNQFIKFGNLAEKTDRDRQIEYRTCLNYVHQRAARYLCDNDGNLHTQPIKITGWIYPGATVKHYALGKATQFAETPANFLALLFAPLACAYVGISSDLQSSNLQNGIVVPEVTDLSAPVSSTGYYRASGWADAGLKFLDRSAALEEASANNRYRCTTILFGNVAWSKQQQTQLLIEWIDIDRHNLAQYDLIRRLLIKNRLFLKRRECQFALLLIEIAALVGMLFLAKFISIDTETDFNPLLKTVAENLIRGRPWWWQFADAFNNEPAYQSLQLYRDRLTQMLENTQWDTATQALFVKACHQALRNTFGKIAGHTKEGYDPQFERKVIQIRADLDRCQNAASFRDFIHSFWGNAGTIPILQESWQELLPITTGQKDWKMAKSLFFLALASYKSENRNPPNNSQQSSTDDSEPAG